ncbi:CCA tRNA nucleotidyltransferase [Paenibacillus sp. GD4]|uniref:CCA tRNA nucleotidyltransferase n=1 Tax=Paenibacillus sp. GD4 TaxID=3068890 RepID=UPI0027966DC7|nr:CCA tRNA nucleotidyltransferase [Paenibacillus sp. GD4]MDQ1909382.1 CCA tRNA nucleotidyltransferase [Paenibacillus sp. GD4]
MMNDKDVASRSGPLEQGAMKIVETLTDRGYEAYLVGGCVRDKQLQRPVKDYDIATSARPEQVQKLFERTIPTGLQHGTVTVMIDKEPYEVTTFRREAEYEAFRRPTEVEYIDNLLEDLQRRDFTMNAMAINRAGELVDPFGGRQDLERGVLRCVGNPVERFGEDALRIFRCLRFASEYDLTIEETTWAGLLAQVPLLKHIALERVRAELERMMEGRNPQTALRLLIESRALSFVKEKLLLADLDKFEQDLPLLEGLASEQRWACLYMRIGASSAEAKEDLHVLTFSNQRIEAVSRILLAQETLEELRAAQTDESEAWKLSVLHAGMAAVRGLAAIITKELDEVTVWLDEMPVTEMKQLEISGKDLVGAFDMKAGPWVGKVLLQLLQQAALGRLSNERDALLKEAKAVYSKVQVIQT